MFGVADDAGRVSTGGVGARAGHVADPLSGRRAAAGVGAVAWPPLGPVLARRLLEGLVVHLRPAMARDVGACVGVAFGGVGGPDGEVADARDVGVPRGPASEGATRDPS